MNHHLHQHDATNFCSHLPIMLAGLIHRVEDAMGNLPPTLEEMEEDEDHDRGVTTLSTTTTTTRMLASNVTTTTPSFLPPSLTTNNNNNTTNSNSSMEQYDRRPTPMQISSLPTKSMATVSSSSSTTSSSTISSMTSHPFPTPFYSKPAKDGGLYHLSKAKIDEFLQPMLQSLIELDAEALLQLQRVSQGGAQVSDGARVQPIHTKVLPSQPPDCVRYLHIAEVPDQYSIGIFVFPPNAKIPLHDHPGMCVLSRILYGEVSRVSLDLLEESEETALVQQLQHQLQQQPSTTITAKTWFHHAVTWQPPPSLLNLFPSDANAASGMPHSSSTTSSSTNSSNSNSTKPRRRLAMLNAVDRLVVPQVTSLYPYEGNLHEFTAGPEGAAVLDVLLPPYGQEDCTFYDIVPLPLPSGNSIATATAADNHHQQQQHNGNMDERRRCWIVPTGQPEEFHCLSGRYLNIGCSNS